jgi:hypothetical protein
MEKYKMIPEKIGFPMICLFILTTMFLEGCQPKKSAVFTNNCVAPCWRQITPGQTNRDSAVNIVDQFGDIDKVGVTKLQDGWNIFSYILSFGLISGEKVEIYVIDDIVARISFSKSDGIASFSECIDAFGDPEYIARSSILGAGPFFLPASSAYHSWMFALSPKKGIVFGYDSYSTNPDLGQKTEISDIQFFDVQKYDQLLENGFLVYSENGFSKNKLQTWKGYGNINELYPE